MIHIRACIKHQSNILFSFIYCAASILLVVSSSTLFPVVSIDVPLRDVSAGNLLIAASVCLSIFDLKNEVVLFIKLKNMGRLCLIYFFLNILGSILFLMGSICSIYVPNKIYQSYYLFMMGSCCFIFKYCRRSAEIAKQTPEKIKVFKIDLSNAQLNSFCMYLFGAIGFAVYGLGNFLNSRVPWWEDKVFETIVCCSGGILMNISSIFAVWSTLGKKEEIVQLSVPNSGKNLQ